MNSEEELVEPYWNLDRLIICMLIVFAITFGASMFVSVGLYDSCDTSNSWYCYGGNTAYSLSTALFLPLLAIVIVGVPFYFLFLKPHGQKADEYNREKTKVEYIKKLNTRLAEYRELLDDGMITKAGYDFVVERINISIEQVNQGVFDTVDDWKVVQKLDVLAAQRENAP